jgi:hypothetical protein
MNDPAYIHDFFLSHSSTDKAGVRAVAERLRADGLRVWFDEWEIPVAGTRQSAAFSSKSRGMQEVEDGGALPSRSYVEKIDEEIKHSRVLACPAVASVPRWTCRAKASARRRKPRENKLWATRSANL